MLADTPADTLTPDTTAFGDCGDVGSKKCGASNSFVPYMAQNHREKYLKRNASGEITVSRVACGDCSAEKKGRGGGVVVVRQRSYRRLLTNPASLSILIASSSDGADADTPLGQLSCCEP